MIHLAVLHSVDCAAESDLFWLLFSEHIVVSIINLSLLFLIY
jgi:hypothetical protein